MTDPLDGNGRDSAGITIVDNPAPAWSGDSAWTIDTVPAFTIGDTVEGRRSQIENVLKAILLSNGSVLLLQEYREGGQNGYAAYVFDSSQRRISIARPGDGPGELSGSIPTLTESGPDTLLFWTSGNRRLTQILANGTFLKAATLQQPDTRNARVYLANAPVAIRADGGLVFFVDGDKPVRNGPFTKTVVVYVLEDSAKTLMSFGSFPVQEMMVSDYQSSAGFVAFGMGGNPFQKPRSFLFTTGRYALTTSERNKWELRQYRKNGQLARIVRAAIPEPPIPDTLANGAGFPVPSGLSAIDTLYDDRAGHIWVGRNKAMEAVRVR